MSGFIGIPKVSGEFGIPEPYNLNDSRVVKKFICNYLCKDNSRFNRVDFLNLIKKQIYNIGAYPSSVIDEGIADIKTDINNLLKYCLEDLRKNGLVVSDYSKTENNNFEQYGKSDLLNLFCLQIENYDISIIEEIAKSVKIAEINIKKDKNVDKAVSLLKSLEKHSNNLSKIEDLDKMTILKLNQLGIVNISLNGSITISKLGQMFLSIVTKKK